MVRDCPARGGRPKRSVRARRCGNVTGCAACLRVRGIGAAVAPVTGGLPLAGRGQADRPERPSSPAVPPDSWRSTSSRFTTSRSASRFCTEPARAGTARRAPWRAPLSPRLWRPHNPGAQRTPLLARPLAKRPFRDRKGPLTWEPPIGIEPMTYALREACARATKPLPAQTARRMAPEALIPLENLQRLVPRPVPRLAGRPSGTQLFTPQSPGRLLSMHTLENCQGVVDTRAHGPGGGRR